MGKEGRKPGRQPGRQAGREGREEERRVEGYIHWHCSTLCPVLASCACAVGSALARLGAWSFPRRPSRKKTTIVGPPGRGEGRRNSTEQNREEGPRRL